MIQLLNNKCSSYLEEHVDIVFLILRAIFTCHNQSKYKRKKSYQKKIGITDRIKLEEYIFRNSGFSGASVTLVQRAAQGVLAKNLLMFVTVIICLVFIE